MEAKDMAELQRIPTFSSPRVWEIAVWTIESEKSWQKKFWRRKNNKDGLCRLILGSWQDVKRGNT